jgi:hypothetical protein
MWPLGVVPQKPVNEPLVEGIEVIVKIKKMEVGEFFLDRPVEPLDVSIHFGREEGRGCVK